MSIQDGSVTWQKDFIMSLRKLPLVIGYNKKQTFASSGTFTPSMTGLYRITLQGGGGGGNHANTSIAGGGGGQGGKLSFYANLTANTAYSFVIGAGGSQGNPASDGGATSITISDDVYTAYGGGAGSYGTATGSVAISIGGRGGRCTINNNIVAGENGVAGGFGFRSQNALAIGGIGGGYYGGPGGLSSGYTGWYGSGGSGGGYDSNGGHQGAPGGSGYITFEWFDPSEAFPNIFANLDS